MRCHAPQVDFVVRHFLSLAQLLCAGSRAHTLHMQLFLTLSHACRSICPHTHLSSHLTRVLMPYCHAPIPQQTLKQKLVQSYLNQFSDILNRFFRFLIVLVLFSVTVFSKSSPVNQQPLTSSLFSILTNQFSAFQIDF